MNIREDALRIVAVMSKAGLTGADNDIAPLEPGSFQLIGRKNLNAAE